MLIPKADRKKIHESVLLTLIRTGAIELVIRELGIRDIVHLDHEPPSAHLPIE